MTRTSSFSAFAASLGVDFTPAQSVLFRIAFDGVELSSLSGDDRERARTLFGDIDTIPELARDTITIVKGARVGGTRFSSLRLLHLALTHPLDTLARGEHGFAIIVAPDLRLARQALRYALGEVRARPALARLLVGETRADGFTLRRPDGQHVAIECLPATRGGSALRGRSLVGAQLSEAAFFRDSEFVVNDAELFRAIAPRILRGGQIIIESTPWTETGLLYELDRDQFGAPSSTLVAHAPTTLMRPDPRTRAIVAAERARDPENAAREFDAQFLGGGAGIFFDPHSLELAVDKTRADVTRGNGAPIGVGVDLGLVSDSSAIAVVALIEQRFELLQLEELRPQKGAPLKLSEVIATFAEVMRSHGVREFLADSHSREPAREWCDREKIELHSAPDGANGKHVTYVGLQSAFREGRVVMPHHPRLLAQLRGVVSRPTPGGLISISSPRRAGQGHGDLVSALVLAVFAASRSLTPARAHGSHFTTWNLDTAPIGDGFLDRLSGG